MVFRVPDTGNPPSLPAAGQAGVDAKVEDAEASYRPTMLGRMVFENDND